MANRCLGIDSTNHQCTRDAGDKFLCAKHKDQEVIAGGATVGDMFEERTLLIRDGENVHIQPEGGGRAVVETEIMREFGGGQEVKRFLRES